MIIDNGKVHCNACMRDITPRAGSSTLTKGEHHFCGMKCFTVWHRASLGLLPDNHAPPLPMWLRFWLMLRYRSGRSPATQ
jgi:hypothetical protein